VEAIQAFQSALFTHIGTIRYTDGRSKTQRNFARDAKKLETHAGILPIVGRAGHLGDLRFFAKRELFYTPFLGMAAYFLNFVFLSRRWEKDRHKLGRIFGEMTQVDDG
jgi:hypothetical protein